MKKHIIVYILALFLLLTNIVQAGSKIVTKEYKISANDGFLLNAELNYPKIANKNNYSTVVLLHSLGYNSDWWEDFPKKLLENGYAVLKIDFRGHGKSIYNSKLNKISWKSLNNNAYTKYPDDIITILNYVKSENKRIFFNDWAIVGADIGSSAGIITANKIEYKPKTIVIISPVVRTRGLYVPVNLAELNNIDILSISGTDDLTGQNAQNYLKKFAQSEFAIYNSESKSNGMLLLKNDSSLSTIILKWLEDYLKP